MENCGIYKITSPSERVYIGQSKDLTRRFKDYLTISKSKNQVLLNSSFKKYGVENHTFEIIEECPLEDLNCRERYWQDFYDVLNGGLNCILTDTDALPKILSEDTKKRISENLIGRFSGENHPLFGISCSEETKKRISVANKGRIVTQEVKDKTSNTLLGRKLSQEWKDNIRKSKSGENHPLYGKIRGEHHGAKVVVNIESGIFYDCVKDAAEAYGINYSTLKDYLKGRYPNKSSLKYC